MWGELRSNACLVPTSRGQIRVVLSQTSRLVCSSHQRKSRGPGRTAVLFGQTRDVESKGRVQFYHKHKWGVILGNYSTLEREPVSSSSQVESNS